MLEQKNNPAKIKVFLCHAKEDIEEVRKIYAYLLTSGFDMWLDEEKLLPGHNWKEEVLKAEHAADAILICLSKNSVKKSGFIQHEIKEALTIAKEKPPGAIFVLPVKLDECETPFILKDIHWANWFSKNGPDKLKEALRELVNQTDHSSRVTRQTDPTKEPEDKKSVNPLETKSLPNKKRPIATERKSTYRHESQLKKTTNNKGLSINEISILVFLAIAFFVGYTILSGEYFTPLSSPDNLNTSPNLTLDMFERTSAPNDTASLTPLPGQIIDAKGVSMILIPPGLYAIGSNVNSDEQPIHTVSLDNYYIDQYEVTNLLYASCVEAGICKKPIFLSSHNRNDYYQNQHYSYYPVINITWEMARTFCENWRSGQLPTESEWEIAARGENDFIYPWGNDINCEFANFNNEGNYCIGDTTPIGNYNNGKSSFSTYDMAGNVSEWVMDWYDSNYYSSTAPSEINPQGPSLGKYKVIRGGSWKDSAYALRMSNRNWLDPNDFNDYLGFRCVFHP